MRKKIIKKSQCFESINNICKTNKLTPATAAILLNRNINTKGKIDAFFDVSLKKMQYPVGLKDVDIAVKRIVCAIEKNEKILIFGDYDADGITATTILYEFLKYCKADVSYYIPCRIAEGYSLKPSHVLDAAANNIDLIVTVDCGSSSFDAVKEASFNNIDVIITDHHEIEGKIPEAFAVVNPKRKDCRSGLFYLAGVGVVFYLLICLRKYLRDNQFWTDMPEPNLKDSCDLVAIGTVADIVPVISDNRLITKAGIEILKTGKRTGINALIKVCKTDKKYIGAGDIAFKIAPRINASGRIDHANTAVRLLLEKNENKALKLALKLDEFNTQRKIIENRMLVNIIMYIENNHYLLDNKSLVLSNKNWHKGILGIIASRLVERYYRPVFLISIQNDTGIASGRSIPGFNLYEGLCSCKEYITDFGGHAMAAGFKIDKEKVEIFKEKFEKNVIEKTDAKTFEPEILIDYQLSFDDITDRLLCELELLQPFGPEMEEPFFLSKNVKVCFSKTVGGNHRYMVLNQPESRMKTKINAIKFNADRDDFKKDFFDEIVFKLSYNYYNNKKSKQIIIEQM